MPYSEDRLESDWQGLANPMQNLEEKTDQTCHDKDPWILRLLNAFYKL